MGDNVSLLGGDLFLLGGDLLSVLDSGLLRVGGDGIRVRSSWNLGEDQSLIKCPIPPQL